MANSNIVALPDRSFQIVPREHFHRTLTMGYTIGDGWWMADGVITTTVNAVNVLPMAVDDTGFVADLNVPLVIPSATLLANDFEVDSDVLRIVVILPGPDVALVLDGMGNVVVTLPQDANGAFTFDYVVRDGDLTDTASATLIIAAVNDATRIAPLVPLESPEDTRFAFSPPDDVPTDPDGDVLILTLSVAAPLPIPLGVRRCRYRSCRDVAGYQQQPRQHDACH